jgi:catechol 2,3-dioxygenase-like lactoylglutathione lyase family enzyme
MAGITFRGFVPILFVRNVAATAAFFQAGLGFDIDFLHGTPPFYGSVSRGNACLHLRFVHQPNFAELAAQEESLILATVEVSELHGLCKEFDERGVEFAQRPTVQPWGGTDFHIRDPDGNVISFTCRNAHNARGRVDA